MPSIDASHPSPLTATSLTPNAASSPALDLPRQVMRRAVWVAFAALLIGVAAGFVRAGSDIREETRSALALAALLREMGRAPSSTDTDLVEGIDRARQEGALRHLELRLVDARGVTRLAPAAGDREGGPWVDMLVALHARWQGDAASRSLAWLIARPGEATPWMLTLTESRDSERREAMLNLGWALTIAAAATAVMLAAIALNVRRAFVPLRDLVARIAALRQPREQRPLARERLPTMPVRELQVVADAVQRLDDDLAVAQDERRVLSLKVQTLQEDERARLARELHDEFGQRLTALRADLAWLAKRVDGDATAGGVVQGMTAQCEHVQQDLRAVLARLRPAVHLDTEERVAMLPALLEPLLAAWARPQSDAAVGSLHLEAFDAQGRAVPWPSASTASSARPSADSVTGQRRDAGDITMPRELQLAIYRMSQEALTNVARHARAGRVQLRLRLEADAAGHTLTWAAVDDGVGLPADPAVFARGNGLAGMRERAWAHGAELRVRAVQGAGRPDDERATRHADHEARRGLHLDASFRLEHRGDR